MNRASVLVWAIAIAGISGFPSLSDAQETGQKAPVTRELIYCADLMTPEEREAYRARMRAARSAAEQEELRAAHQRDMQARARERGIDPAQCIPQGPQQGRGGSS